MKEVKLYECEICGTRFASESIAKDCESAHKKIIVINKRQYRSKEPYPDKVTIQFSDGKYVDYKR